MVGGVVNGDRRFSEIFCVAAVQLDRIMGRVMSPSAKKKPAKKSAKKSSAKGGKSWVKFPFLGYAWLSLVLAVIFIHVFLARPDWATAMTVIPAWAWLFWMIPAIPLCIGVAARPARVAVLLWLVFAFMFIEEPGDVLEGWLRKGPVDAREGLVPYRIVTHNCRAHPGVLEQIAELKPDIVMLQEAPPLRRVEEFALNLYGESAQVAWNFDTCLITGNRLSDVKTTYASRRFLTRALVDFPGLEQVEVVTLRLSRNQKLWKLWKPSVWREQVASRERQLSQMGTILENASYLKEGRPLIMAGDFNVPQGDGVLEAIEPYLTDAFAEIGRGLGNTFPNDAPLVRIDQVWVSQHFTLVDAFVVPSKASDHRILVVDTMVPDPLFH